MLSKKEIKEKSEKLIQEYGLTVPFTVSSLAAALNIDTELCSEQQIWQIAKSNDGHRLQDKSKEQLLGYYHKQAGKFYINDTNQSMTRQRFTIAHEIGHFILHNDQPNNDFRRVVLKQDLVSFIPNNNNMEIAFVPDEGKREREANEFAAYLLMPDKDIEKRLPLIELWLGGETFIREFATLFGVSLETMRIRLKTFKNEHPDIWSKFNLEYKLF